jgi:formylglycine-generating enzyme required for sulfatase activity
MKKLIILFLLITVAAGLSFAQQKYALVIGNSNYNGIPKLRNPVNDANDMAAALQSLGFTVDKVLDGDLERMETAVTNLKKKLGASRNSYGFFFYAGHGVQANGQNYLIPLQANNILNETHLRDRAVSLQFIMDNLSEAGNELNMIVLDACRDNPFGWSRSGTRGLTVVSSTPSGSIVMYAAASGQKADDGSGRNGLFTSHLLNNLKTAGLSVYEVFDRTMGDVKNTTGGKQDPELSLRFSGANNVYLGSRPTSNTPVQPAPAPAVQPVAPPVQPAPNNMVWIQDGTFQMGSNNGYDNEKPVHTVTLSGFYMGKYEITQKEYQKIMGTNPSHFKGDNLPVEQVSWYDALVFCNKLSMAEGLSPAYSINNSTNPSNWGKEPTDAWNTPVIVSGSNGYRLPTEAQWEYAARGGNGSPGNYTYSGSNNIGDVAWYEDNSGNNTHAVGTKKPNGLGLFDMSGNVAELCWDWYGDYNGRAQTDPAGATSGNGRVERGGCWVNGAASARSVGRVSSLPSYRDDAIGFRVVRPL